MKRHSEMDTKDLHRAIRSKSIVLGGNIKLKIYGLLTCKSGKRMKKGNRVFFTSLSEARNNGFRPCAHCLRKEYNLWNLSKKQVE